MCTSLDACSCDAQYKLLVGPLLAEEAVQTGGGEVASAPCTCPHAPYPPRLSCPDPCLDASCAPCTHQLRTHRRRRPVLRPPGGPVRRHVSARAAVHGGPHGRGRGAAGGCTLHSVPRSCVPIHRHGSPRAAPCACCTPGAGCQQRRATAPHHTPSTFRPPLAYWQVGPGVKLLFPGETVLPLRPFCGAWASGAVWPERELLRVPSVSRHATPRHAQSCNTLSVSKAHPRQCELAREVPQGGLRLA
jgi:hypothetical protein